MLMPLERACTRLDPSRLLLFDVILRKTSQNKKSAGGKTELYAYIPLHDTRIALRRIVRRKRLLYSY